MAGLFAEGGFVLPERGDAGAGPGGGKFTLTLKKGTDGRWLIMSDMDSPNRRRE